MTDAQRLGSTVSYSDNALRVKWEGRVVADPIRFEQYMQAVVRKRLSVAGPTFEAELRDLATARMANEFVGRLLNSVPEIPEWEIGEALAACLLQQDSDKEVRWPWNPRLDRRTPRASLPGPDLVGFCQDAGSVLLLLGEVKTSADVDTPPRVMRGGTGMVRQLGDVATSLNGQLAVLEWLRARCQSSHLTHLYKEAVGRYLGSNGKDLFIIGVLLRDTQPNELDLKAGAQVLAQKLSDLARVELVAWYLPVPIKEWRNL